MTRELGLKVESVDSFRSKPRTNCVRYGMSTVIRALLHGIEGSIRSPAQSLMMVQQSDHFIEPFTDDSEVGLFRSVRKDRF
jgi:hypothetical protein